MIWTLSQVRRAVKANECTLSRLENEMHPFPGRTIHKASLPSLTDCGELIKLCSVVRRYSSQSQKGGEYMSNIEVLAQAAPVCVGQACLRTEER